MATQTETTPTTFLNSFFSDFEAFIVELSSNLIKRADDEDEKAVIREGTAPIPGQISEMKQYVLERAENASKGELNEARRALRMANPTQIMKSGKGLFGNIGSLIGNLGIGRIIQEIKKIVRLIFDAFGWKMPKWLDLILLIIDQLVNLVLGTKSSKFATALSDAEVNYLNELEATVRLQNAVAAGSSNETDETWN